MRFRLSAGLAAAALIGLSGCASTSGDGARNWEKAGASDQDFEEDHGYCVSQGVDQMTMSGGQSPTSTNQGVNQYEFCMEQRGWRRVEKSR